MIEPTDATVPQRDTEADAGHHPAPTASGPLVPEPPRRSGWWRRNRLGLLALLVLVPLAVFSASYRMLTIYLPGQYHRAHVAAAGEPVHLLQVYPYEDGTSSREITVDVTVRLVGVRTASQLGELRAVPGATLWIIDLGFEAPPTSVLDLCTAWLVDDNRREYGTGLGQIDPEQSTFTIASCVPEGATGPQLPISGMADRSTPRPPSWAQQIVVAVPQGVRPTALRIGWAHPDYIELPIRVP